MAYTPNNNPYIPGDPYSYDLKWMVCQIRKALEEYIALNGRVDSLNNSFNALSDYVRNYFANLDISEELDAKLDEMIADGTFAAIIAPYIAESVAAGINYYGGKVSHVETALGDYWLITIPKIQNDGGQAILKVGISDGTVTTPSWITDPQTVTALSQQKKASFAINGGFAQRANNLIPWGSVIIDGEILLNQFDTHTAPVETLGIKADGSWSYYDSQIVDAVEMVNDGVIYAVAGLGAIISHGARTANLATWEANYGAGPWQTIGYDDDNYYIVTTEFVPAGKTGYDLTAISDIYMALGASEAYVLDSGGSTSTTVQSVKLNSNKDDAGLTDRKVATFLYIAKPNITENDPNFDEDVSFSNALGLALDALKSRGAILRLYPLSSNSGDIYDCNELPLDSVGYTYATTLNAPTPAAYWHIFTYGYSNSLKVQLAINHNTDSIAYRACQGGTWHAWQSLSSWAFPPAGSVSDLNDLPTPSFYTTAAGNLNKPDSGRWLVLTYGGVLHAQIAVRETTGAVATRFMSTGNTWSNWAISLSTNTYRNECGTPMTITANQSNTSTLYDEGVITSNGYYLVILDRTGDNVGGASMYLIRYNNGSFTGRTTISESTLVSGPTLGNDGIVKPVSSTVTQSYAVRAIRIY